MRERSISENCKFLKRELGVEDVEMNQDFPEYRGLSFKEFWKALPNK